MIPAVTAGWESFFVAQVGASATLSGLLFVAVSINLSRILAFPSLTARAGEALIVLLSVLAMATFGLVPGQSQTLLGAEVAGTGLAVWSTSVVLQVRAYRDVEQRRWLAMRVVLSEAASLPFIVAGALLVLGRASGLYWLVPGTVLSFAVGVLDAWVLLVEIQR